MMIDEQNKQWSTRENNKAKQTTRVEAKEFMPNRSCNGKEYEERTLIYNENDMDNADNKDVAEKK